MRAAKDIDHVYFARDINQLSINFFAQNFCDLRVVNRDRNDLESGALHVARNVEGRLTCLPLRLDAQHGDRFRFRQQFPDSCGVVDQVVAPIHEPQIYTD